MRLCDGRLKPRPHGSYDIRRQDQALIVTIEGSWNLEAYLEFVEVFKAAAEPLCQQPWGVLVDIRRWGLSTPEVAEADEALQVWTLRNNQRWRAYVSDRSALKQGQIENYSAPVAGGIESRFFDATGDARRWFQDVGILSG